MFSILITSRQKLELKSWAHLYISLYRATITWYLDYDVTLHFIALFRHILQSTIMEIIIIIIYHYGYVLLLLTDLQLELLFE